MKLSIVIPTLEGKVPELPKGDDIEVIVVKGVRPVSAARYQGLMRSTGEYVWFVDDDDEVDCSLRVQDLELDGRPDIIRFKTSCGWMCIGDKIYRREILLAAFDEIGILPFKHCEDGLMYLAALKHAQKVVDVDRIVYRYVQRTGSTLHQFNPDLVQERVQFIDRALTLGEGLMVPGLTFDRACMSKAAVVYIVTQLCRWPVTMRQIRSVCRELVCSPLVVNGLAEIEKDPYAGKMLFAARHPMLIGCYRFMRKNGFVGLGFLSGRFSASGECVGK